MLRDEVPSRLHLRRRCDACEVREGHGHPSRSQPSCVVDCAVQRAEPLHARARSAYDEHCGLALVQVPEEVRLVARLEEINAATDVEVRSSTIPSPHEQCASVAGSSTELGHIVKSLIWGRISRHEGLEVLKLDGTGM